MTTLSSSRRAMCAACLRPASACICGWAAPVDAAVELLILQHPLEVTNAKGSARLLHLSLPGSVLVTGERFDPDALAELLHAGGRRPVLLYPAAPEITGLDPALLQTPPALRLVVLDGTWRKSRKMLHLNPSLQTLPRLALRDMPASQYRIRKAHAPDQLSTLEAAVHALTQLEGPKFQAVLDGFVGWVRVHRAHADTPNSVGTVNRTHPT